MLYSPVLESREYILGQKQEKKEKYPPSPFSNRGNTECANTEPRRAETGEEQVPPFPVPRSRIEGIHLRAETGEGEQVPPFPVLELREYSMCEYRAS